MVVCKKFGYPYLLIIVTCNRQWPKIQRFLSEKGFRPKDCLDIACRVFQFKLDQIMIDFIKGCFFGKVIACILLLFLNQSLLSFTFFLLSN